MKLVYLFFVKIVLMVVLLSHSQKVGGQIVHDIALSSITIPSGSTANYVITGTAKSNNVIVEAGYIGSITLKNVNIELKGSDSPIDIKGKNNCSNLTPVTVVELVLDGTNTLTYSGNKGCAALQVEQGAQINISAANPQDNASGKLNAKVTTDSSGAGISTT